MKRPKNVFLTIEERRKILLNGEDMPTAIFSADKKEYIVKPRTIFGTSKNKKKEGNHMNKKSFFLIVIIAFIAIIVAIFAMKNISSQNPTGIKPTETNSIGTESVETKPIDTDAISIGAIRTGRYDDNARSKYVITSEAELEQFLEEHDNAIEIDKNNLLESYIFIQVETVNSGSIEINFNNVSFDDNKVQFVFDKKVPETGTMDMATWYLVARIPTKYLDDVDISEWR